AALLALPGLAVAALGTSRVLGYYSSVGHAHVPVGSALKWAAIDTMMLAYSAGWVVVPGALVGLAYALVRPRVRVERAFGAFVAAMLALASRVPLSGFTVATNKQDSPFLFAVFKLERLTSVGDGSLLVALAAGALSVLAVALVRTRRGAAVALAISAALGAAA